MARQVSRTRKVAVWMRVKDNEALKRKRKRMNLTQRELAFLARPCSQTTIYLLEKGEMKTLSEELAGRIARRLDADLEDLFEPRVSSPMATATSGQRVSGSAA